MLPVVHRFGEPRANFDGRTQALANARSAALAISRTGAGYAIHMSALLELSEVELNYGDTAVVRNMSMHVNAGEIACLLGASGCGKTTVLRAIAGFNALAGGTITFDNVVIARRGYAVAPERRGLSMVFQDHALFPHLSVLANVQFGIEKLPSTERLARAEKLLALVGLSGYEERFPHELSGGQQQRVALARALAPQPQLVLLDEPFANLDTDLREHLGRAVRQVLKATNTAAVLVTHHQDEAFALADRVGVMHQGAVAQWDTAYNLYHEPANRYVANFIGEGVFIPGTLTARDRVESSLGVIHGNRMYPFALGTRVDLLIRPDDIQPDPAGDIDCRVVGRQFRGAETLYELELQDSVQIMARFPSHMDHAIDEHVRVRVDAEHLVVFRTGEDADAHSGE
jgi:iron(III) transport system ATP-binding protein